MATGETRFPEPPQPALRTALPRAPARLPRTPARRNLRASLPPKEPIMRPWQLFLKKRFSKLSVGKSPQMAKQFHGGTQPEKRPRPWEKGAESRGVAPRFASAPRGWRGAVRYVHALGPLGCRRTPAGGQRCVRAICVASRPRAPVLGAARVSGGGEGQPRPRPRPRPGATRGKLSRSRSHH